MSGAAPQVAFVTLDMAKVLEDAVQQQVLCERDRFHAALIAIAAGDGVYGQQALEYKNIARKALGQAPL